MINFLPVVAAVGLSLSTAPDFALHIPFLRPLLTTNSIASGIATVLAPALAATLFIALALAVVNCLSYRINILPFY